MFLQRFEGIPSFQIVTSQIPGVTFEVFIQSAYTSQSKVLAIWSFGEDARLMSTSVVEI